MTKKENSDNYKQLRDDLSIKATCVCCGRLYETTEACKRAIQLGHMESLCPACDNIDDAEHRMEDR